MYYLDAQLPPSLAGWLRQECGWNVKHIFELDLTDCSDESIFKSIAHEGAVLLTKDIDFSRLMAEHGPPRRVIWLRCGNSSNKRLREWLAKRMPDNILRLTFSDSVIEVR